MSSFLCNVATKTKPPLSRAGADRCYTIWSWQRFGMGLTALRLSIPCAAAGQLHNKREPHLQTKRPHFVSASVWDWLRCACPSRVLPQGSCTTKESHISKGDDFLCKWPRMSKLTGPYCIKKPPLLRRLSFVVLGMGFEPMISRMRILRPGPARRTELVPFWWCKDRANFFTSKKNVRKI